MFKKMLFSVFLISLILFTMVKLSNKTEQMMKYFPIDEQEQFDNASTDISFLPKKHKIIWQVNSKTSIPQYLRQDVSLLYENGLYKGIQQKWQQNIANISLEKIFPIKGIKPSLLTAISFHHAEIHHKDDMITSVQKMSSNQLYLIISNENLTSFHEAQSEKELKLADEINEEIKQYLMSIWKSWMAEFQIAEEQYTLIPLFDLIYCEDSSLGSLSINKTEKVLGQLWEGLYKNYIISLIGGQENSNHPMPLILLAKDESHLIVLYEVNNEHKKLIQQIPS